MQVGNFELLYKKEQSQSLAGDFFPYDCSSVNRPEYREIFGFRKFVNEKPWMAFSHSGLFSSKFFDKMGITSAELNFFLETNPGYDVYLFHPYPKELSIANHFMELAELEHPGISEMVALVWDRIFNCPPPVLTIPDDQGLICHCNYFIGSKFFWKGYLHFINRFCELLVHESGKPLRDLTPYTLSRNSETHLPIAVFVFERCLSHYLKMRSDELSVISYGLENSAWVPPEIFVGEHNYVDELKLQINTAVLADPVVSNFEREKAVRSYYESRKERCINE